MRPFRRILVRAWLALAASMLTSCSDAGPAAAPGTRTVFDATGAQVRVPPSITRIVTTVPGLTATTEALGAGDLLVAISDQDPKSGARAALARIPVFPIIPAETLAALHPDLILVDPTLSPRDIAPLRERFPGTFASDSTSLDGLRTTFVRLGEALGRTAEAKRLTDELDAARTQARAAGSPTALLLTWADPPSVIALGPGSLMHDMLLAVGGRNVASDLGRPSGPIASELVVERDPAFIVLAGATFSDALRSRWSTVRAVREGRVVEAGMDDFMQAGPRTAGALRRLAQLLSPTGATK